MKICGTAMLQTVGVGERVEFFILSAGVANQKKKKKETRLGCCN